ncbi:glycosyl hydrolase family 28 protein [Novosphingobium resinovorum]|uniref:glycosyl hydrolase family 28 protein n=1 Tax=Novosphingobium resinovorum TaxID=158500 RepID=UPI002ED32BC8|nr:glycosyl hydrolase family 28 protein [Novosphingobium resinovorum]
MRKAKILRRTGICLAAVALSCAAVPAALAAQDGLRVYPVPKGLMYSAFNDDFTVRVRTPGGQWKDLYEYRVQVDTDTRQNASMVYFDFQGTVEIEVQKNNGHFDTVSVAPLASAVKPNRQGNIVRMTLTSPESFSLQFDDDRLHNLHILAGAVPAAAPSGPNVRVFEAGLHLPPEGSDVFPVKSGERIYLAGGAVLKGSFALEGVKDVSITGRGMLWDPGRAIDLEKAKDIAISDLIMVNTDRKDAARVINIRNSSNVALHNVTGFTSGKWSDGINISTSQHVSVDGGYLRVSDDAVVVYAVADCPLCRQRAAQTGIPDINPPGDTFDISVRNLRIWNDVAHALYIGHFGDNADPRTIRDVTFDNIDIANLDEDDPDWEGVIAAYSGDSTLIRNITFSNIRVDRIEEGKLINIVAGNNARYNKAPGRGIDGVTIRNVTFTGEGMPSQSIISGLSAKTAVRNITIENLSIAGQRIDAPQAADMVVGKHVESLRIR